MINVYEAVSSNKAKSWLVILAFAGFVALAVWVIASALSYYFGYQLGGLGAGGVALIISGLVSFGSYWFSDKIVLTISGARQANRKEHFLFYTVAENLSLASGLPKPKLYVINDTAPNAFATGRDPKHAVICATTGLLQKLNRTELEGVIAHELSHVRNYDTRLMSVVTVMIGVLALLADWLLRASFYVRGSNDDNKSSGALILFFGFLFALFSPIIARLIQLAVSRRREFLADASAVEITRQPQGLINALTKIASDHEPLEVANKATAHLYIINPFKEKIKGPVGWFANLFNTHPLVQERIKALEKMT